MNRYLLTALFILFIASGLTASGKPGNISGKVLDDLGKPVVFASVLLLGEDSTLIKTEITNEKGEYGLTLVDNGSYYIKVSSLNYSNYFSEKLTITGNTIKVPDITLISKGTELKEVGIRAQKPFVEIHADKLVVNVENSIVNAGSSILDVIARSPGVNVDQNDNISLKGKQGVNVMINGKIQPISAQELGNLLKSMPSNSVENIEIISNPSSKYDAAGTAGIINIKMKKDKKMGFNGSVNANYIQGVYGKTTEGFNVNYRNKRFNLFTNYNYSYRVGFNHLTLERKFYDNDTFKAAYQQDNNYLYHITGHVGSIGADYNLSSKTIVGLAVNGNFTDFRRDGANYSYVFDSVNNVSSRFSTDNASPNQWYNCAVNLNLRHTFDSTGRSLSADADYATYPSTGTQDYTTNLYDADGTLTSKIPQILRGEQNGLTQIRSFKADYAHPLKNGAKIEAGIKISYVTADNDLKFFNGVDNNTHYVLDTTKTYHFIYKENINAAYINFSKDWSKWSTQLGLRVEQTIADGNDVTSDSTFSRNYMQPFPSLAVQRHLDANNDLGITLSRRIQRPNYEQLNPFKFYLDPTTYKAGYPYLNPALSYAVELSYVYKQKLITTLNYTITNAPLIEVIQPSTDEERVTIQTTKNLTSMAYYGINGSYQFRITKWWNNVTNVNIYYSEYTGNIAGSYLQTGQGTFDIYTNNSFILPKNFSAELSGYYQAPQQYGYMNLRPQWMVNVGIQKNLFDKRATVRLNASDIFWRGYPSATSDYKDYTEFFVAKRDTRQVTMSFTYRFGKRSVPQSQRHNGGAEDEKRRAGGSGA
ncbi:MAG: TonB-dependent receptor [Flavipsychrobacter sp.]|jgi:hypothetical protein|nr:TonB-dependent receptor [Flavipsychrobacter sp.]